MPQRSLEPRAPFEEARGTEREEPRCIELGAAVGEHELRVLEFCERAAERLAIACVFDPGCERRFGELPERCHKCTDWMTGAAERVRPQAAAVLVEPTWQRLNAVQAR